MDDSQLVSDPITLPTAPSGVSYDAATPAPAAPKTVAPATQSPLDILDQILNDAQAKAEDVAKQKEAEEEAKVKAEQERQRLLDQEKIKQQLTDLQSMAYSPQNKARLEQEATLKTEQQHQSDELDGMQIYQVGHAKI
jgi:hypothetical protein